METTIPGIIEATGLGASVASLIVGGGGAANGLLTRFGKAGISILKEIKLARNITVLGKVGKYERMANSLGANYFHISDEAWKAMTDAERWVKIRHFLIR